MPYSKPFDIAVIGAGATKLSVVALDLENAEEACAVGKQMAETTGRTVTVLECRRRGPRHFSRCQ